MNIGLIKSLSIYQWVKCVAAALAGLLMLLLVVGSIWAATLPPAPVVLPSIEALQAATVVLSAEDAESHYLDGFVPNNSDEALLSGSAESTPDDVSIMTSRPLFWEGRRPVAIDDPQVDVVEENVGSVKASELDKVELAGVYFAGDASGVIVRTNGQRMRIALGDSLMGWKLESVDAAEVHFSNAGQRKTIRLEHAGGADYTPAASRKNRSSAEPPRVNRTQEPND
jgi:hypothetical protein